VTSKNLLLGALIVVSLSISGYRLLSPHSRGAEQRRSMADDLAAFVAKEAAKESKGGLLILAPLDDVQDPFPGQLARSAEKHMKAAGFAPVAVERVPYNPALEDTGEPIERSAFLGLLKSHPEAAVVLSLIGVPRLSEADLPAAGRPRIVIATIVKMPYLDALPRGMIDFSINARRKWSNDDRNPEMGGLDESFVIHRYNKK
jgi:hypothetical protein